MSLSAQRSFTLHKPKPHHFDEDDRDELYPHRPSLPPIPDLRFEHSYLRSIQRFITARQDQTSSSVYGGKSKDEVTLQTCSEVIDIQWTKVFWITMRDQVISPLLQGTLWAIAGYYLSPVAAQFGSRVGGYTRSLFPSQEGSGVTWLRSWVGGLGFGAPTTRSSLNQI
ncbi:hypothetical protein E4T56_gene11490 [Termitomyces sp. T112]|nr:hypothetical protein E4T56_gene11490 [Termitomyces sp. T112]